MLYETLLVLHSLIRWLVVIFAIITLVRAYLGWFGNKTWRKSDNRVGMLFGSFLDLQMLIGLILYFFVSPITTAAFRNFGPAMANADVRYFSVEHVLLMVVGVVLAHIGSSKVKKEANDASKFKIAAIWYSVAVLVILVAIPWPFLPSGRPLFRFGF
jgi:hypothetical protein